jgi:putative ABC transport system substrate-binding protein
VGILSPLSKSDPQSLARISTFVRGLEQLGWSEGRNLRIEYRWSNGQAENIRKNAVELAELSPDVIAATGSVTVGPLLQVTRTIPVVFVEVPDPVGADFVDSLARPGRNATGFINFEFGISAKWLELLKQIGPAITHVGIVRDPTIAAGPAQFAAIQTVASAVGVEISPINLRSAGEIDAVFAAFAQKPNGGLVVTGSGLAVTHRDSIISAAEKHRLPTIYFQRLFAAAGGLMSYGPDFLVQHRSAAGYVDRILRGEKPAELPVQTPTRYELVINLKTAKALGLTIPPIVLARADEVIE